MKDSINVAVIQMTSGKNWQKNLDKAKLLIKAAAEKGAELVVLPEFFIRIANTCDTEFSQITEELGNGLIQNQLAQLSLDNNTYLVAGTLPIKAENSNKCYNTALVYSPKGELICHYHKIHLFKFDNGEQRFDESITFASGNNIKTFSIGNFTFGLSICYDLRFPELFRNMAGVDGFIMPAAFTYQTGKAHWETLIKARAIENQCYMLAANQTGMHDNGRQSYGHSLIVNPWGEIKEIMPDGEGFILSIISKEELVNVRSILPALNHRRI